MIVAAVFSTSHIAVTALVSGVIAAGVGGARLRGERRALDSLAVGLLTAGAVFLLRKSANMPQLNDYCQQGFSENDWLAPAVTFVVLGIYGAARRATEPRRFEQVRAAATVVAFAVVVLTI